MSEIWAALLAAIGLMVGLAILIFIIAFFALIAFVIVGYVGQFFGFWKVPNSDWKRPKW